MKSQKKQFRFPVVIEFDEEAEMYVAIVPGLPGAHTQARTLDELEENIKEVVELCLEEASKQGDLKFPKFVGIHQVEVACK